MKKWVVYNKRQKKIIDYLDELPFVLSDIEVDFEPDFIDLFNNIYVRIHENEGTQKTAQK